MKKSGTGSGGGLGSRNVVRKPVITGKSARGIDPGGPAQLGSSLGNHSTDHSNTLSYRGEKWFDGKTPAGGGQRLGNEVSAKTVCGPGGSRQVMARGSQGQHGSANPGSPAPGANKPIFPGFK